MPKMWKAGKAHSLAHLRSHPNRALVTLPNMYEDLKSAVAADMPRLKVLLRELVRLETVSADGFDPAKLRAGAAHGIAYYDDEALGQALNPPRVEDAVEEEA